MKQYAFCPLFFAKERKKAFKEKLEGNLQVDFFAVRQIGAARDMPTTSFYDHIIV